MVSIFILAFQNMSTHIMRLTIQIRTMTGHSSLLCLVDTRLRKLEQFQWLSNITNTVSSIFKLFNWGKGYEELVEACDRLKLAIQNPQFFCETRFANSVRKVYGNFLADLSAIIACLENTKFEMHDGDASEREKAQQAKERRPSKRSSIK